MGEALGAREEEPASSERPAPVISVMLAVPDAQAASAWYEAALGARQLWSLGSVVGMEVEGAPFLLGQPENNGWNTPHATPSVIATVDGRLSTGDEGGAGDACGRLRRESERPRPPLLPSRTGQRSVARLCAQNRTSMTFPLSNTTVIAG